MLDQRRVAAQPDEERERLFTERYEGLLAWAMRLTNQQREAAEDLVQDAFVQFVLGRTRLEEIENIDGYLRRMLRYMHVARLSRSAQHLHDSALSIADYDSGRLGWTTIEPPRRMQAFEELHQICIYACSRKESSRAGSVLILRFFHDYFPTEIASILNSSRHCIDEWQRLARREAKLFMNEPGRLRFVNARMQADRQQVKYLNSDCDLMLELRQMIFNSRRGGCLPPEELAEVYSGTQTEALGTARLAHIVSCPVCLDAVNSLLGLPLLAQRYHTEPSEPKQEPPDDTNGGGASGGGSGDLTTKFARRLRETQEHKPQELRISVNGFLVSSLKVSSDLSELDLNLTPDDPIEFVEVSSEQGVQMLFFSVDPHAPQNEQWAWIELSEGRLLEACFRNENGPSLRVVYKDPLPDVASVNAETTNGLSSPLFIVPEVGELRGEKVGNERFGLHLLSRCRRLINKFRSATRRPLLEVEEASSPASTRTTRAPFGDVFAERKHSRKLGWLVLLISLIVIAGLLFFRARLAPSLTAAAVLENASVAEKTGAVPADRVTHRVLNLEERRSAEGAVVAQHKIEIWQNHANGVTAQRLYDGSNRLISGAWEKADQSRVVYHHGAKPQRQPLVATPDDLLLNPEDIWQLQPSAQSFTTLIAQPALAEIEERATTYVVRFDKGRTVGATRLLRATLTLSKSDLHAIEQTLLLQRGGDLHEYRFVEAQLERVSLKDVAPAAFEIEPELTGGAGELGRPGDWALRDLTASRVPPSPSTSAPPVASAELEVDVAYLLNRAKADRNEQVNLTRSAGGSLRVEGVVDSQERKDEFLRALAPVSNNPAVTIDIRTVGEAIQRPLNLSAAAIESPEETANTVAAEDDLRAYFQQQDPGGSIDQSIRNYSSRVVRHAYAALFHAIQLKQLINRFANVDMRTVAPDARLKWLAMLHEHATGFENENNLLRQELQLVFSTVGSVTEEPVIESDADLTRAVERLHRLALSDNEAVRSAFTISAQNSATAVKAASFWQSLERAAQLAKRIRQYQTASN